MRVLHAVLPIGGGVEQLPPYLNRIDQANTLVSAVSAAIGSVAITGPNEIRHAATATRGRWRIGPSAPCAALARNAGEMAPMFAALARNAAALARRRAPECS
jgi:hypothetical protein